MNENARFVLISIENPKVRHWPEYQVFLFRGYWRGHFRDQMGRVEERKGYQREEALPPLSFFAAVFWTSRNVGASVGYLFAALFICSFPLSPRNA